MTASIVALHLAPRPHAPTRAVPRALARAGAGLEGDYHAEAGGEAQVLLADQETLESLGLEPGQIREQVTVRGLDLYAAPPGTRLRVGEAELELAEAAEPCERMEALRAGLESALRGRRGRFARVVRGGVLAVGDPIQRGPSR